MRRELIIVPNERHVVRLSRKYLPFRDHDAIPFSENSPEVRAQRLTVLLKVLKGEELSVVTTLLSLARYTISPENLKKNTRVYSVGDAFDLDPESLVELGYERVGTVREKGEFAVRGDIVDVFPPNAEAPYRLELFDRTIEDIRIFDPMSQRSVSGVEKLEIPPAREYTSAEHAFDTVVGYFEDSVPSIDYFEGFKIMVWDLERAVEETRRRLKELLGLAGNRSEYFRSKSFVDIKYVLEKIADHEPIEIDTRSIEIERVERVERERRPVFDVEELERGNLVVHKDYGIGIFEGVFTLESPSGKRDFIKLRYSDSNLYVPVERISRIHKYIGPENVQVDSIRSSRWRRRVRSAEKDIERRVRELVELYAKRNEIRGLSLPGDPKLEEEFASTFPHVETRDQLEAIERVLEDLSSEKPMDRLVSGDSGFGKTEVALRAAFRAVVSGKQVAVIVPTVVLANQHYRTFKERMERFGVVVELLDGTRTRSERQKILENLRKGRIDVVIGTHSLLSDSVVFSDLGLVIIDEEHKFGVEQKEKLKKLRLDVNVLSMSATPIPRTLQMALSGMRDMSVINTPPLGRKPVTVYVTEYSDSIVKSAVARELARGGQILYVHNRIEELDEVLKKLKILLPAVSMAVAHGRMGKRKLEKVVESFYSGDIDLLLCTAIVESGLDIPTVNTIIIDDAHRYGLAQLYQLRGRVGRRSVRGYAYFLYPKGISKRAVERLRVMERISGPGGGMEVALKDLEMRGYGDLLGLDQHGHVESIGYRYYVELIKKAVAKVKGEGIGAELDVEIENFPGSVHIPESYVPDPMERMRIYRRVSHAVSVSDIEELKEELLDRFGRVPESVENLLRIGRLRIAASEVGIEKIVFDGNDVILKFRSLPPLIEGVHLLNERKKIAILYNTDLEGLEKLLGDVK